MAHVPWLGQLLFRAPYFANDLKAFRKSAETRVLKRQAEGSQYKDIFHHLVSTHCYTGSSVTDLVQIDENGIHAQPPSVAELISDGT